VSVEEEAEIIQGVADDQGAPPEDNSEIEIVAVEDVGAEATKHLERLIIERADFASEPLYAEVPVIDAQLPIEVYSEPPEAVVVEEVEATIVEAVAAETIERIIEAPLESADPAEVQTAAVDESESATVETLDEARVSIVEVPVVEEVESFVAEEMETPVTERVEIFSALPEFTSETEVLASLPKITTETEVLAAPETATDEVVEDPSEDTQDLPAADFKVDAAVVDVAVDLSDAVYAQALDTDESEISVSISATAGTNDATVVSDDHEPPVVAEAEFDQIATAEALPVSIDDDVEAREGIAIDQGAPVAETTEDAAEDVVAAVAGYLPLPVTDASESLHAAELEDAVGGPIAEVADERPEAAVAEELEAPVYEEVVFEAMGRTAEAPLECADAQIATVDESDAANIEPLNEVADGPMAEAIGVVVAEAGEAPFVEESEPFVGEEAHAPVPEEVKAEEPHAPIADINKFEGPIIEATDTLSALAELKSELNETEVLAVPETTTDHE
ncbi:hypothetical protein BDK51DRAFT_42132, partial [Blyttiomyces helicus]